RWTDPVLGPIPPTVFIPLAEHIGLMPRLGEWVLRTAIEEAVQWAAVGPADPYVAVNLSAVQLQDPELSRRIGEVVTRSGLEPAKLLLEVTESALVEHLPVAVDVLQELRARGMRVAIDDFGTGYSSL